jgi:hypothetical protein
VTNYGGAPAGPFKVGLQGAYAADFIIVSDTCAGVFIPPMGSCTVSVSFRPSSEGSRIATLVLYGPESIIASANLGGFGIPAGSALRLTDAAGMTISEWHFPNGRGTMVGARSAEIAVLVHNDDDVLETGQLALKMGGMNAGDFVIVKTDCSVSLAPHGICTIVLAFAPTVVGLRYADLSVYAAAGGSVTLTMTGLGAIHTLE